MQTNNYDEARVYFNRNAQHGWKHIESFIVSEQMFERLLKDDFPRGAVIKLSDYADPRTLPRTNVRINGYPILVSSGYTQPYGVTYIMYEDKFNEEVLGLLLMNISDQINVPSILWICQFVTQKMLMNTLIDTIPNTLK